jgi:hypothetical protein
MRNFDSFFRLPIAIGAFFLACAAHPEWSEFSLQEGRFSILLPIRPEEISPTSQPEPRPDLRVRAYQAKFGCAYFNVNFFESSHTDIPVKPIVDKLLSRLGGQTQQESVEIVGNHNDHLLMINYSASFLRDGNEFVVRGSIIGDGRKSYDFYTLRQVSCDDQGTIDRFLSSFNLTPVQ